MQYCSHKVCLVIRLHRKRKLSKTTNPVQNASSAWITVVYYIFTSCFPMLVICHLKIYLTEAGVNHEAGMLSLSGAPSIIFHTCRYLTYVSFVIWEVILANFWPHKELIGAYIYNAYITLYHCKNKDIHSLINENYEDWYIMIYHFIWHPCILIHSISVVKGNTKDHHKNCSLQTASLLGTHALRLG